MTEFTPWAGLTGGALIGLSAAYLLVFSGRIAGVSGILGGLLALWTAETWWRLSFVLGLVGGAALAAFLVPTVDPTVMLNPSWTVLAVGGFLVGAGTRIGNGCTSGHGVCGIPRLSTRSITATGVFFGVAALTVFILRHVI
ncbi:MAG: YeeE/YedE thiosulfate transporter family protein [Pseudomonadota bacterium]